MDSHTLEFLALFVAAPLVVAIVFEILIRIDRKD